jgi:peptidoglycan/LPS O-acetylase OafA/YrhL
MQTETRPRFYLPELDGLRFVAFLLVFIHNAPSISSSKIWTLLHEYGWIGVELFFCLSGFLITKLLVMEYQQTGEIDIRRFYIRRILRIWPLYYFYLMVGLLFILFTDGWMPILSLHIAGLTTFTYDVAYLFLTHKVFAVYFHLWTISYEEQFYVVIPWMVRKIMRVAGSTGLVVFAVLVVGNALRSMFIYFNAKHPVIYMLPITHFEAMLGGIAAGFGTFDGNSRRVKNWIFLLGGLALIAIVVRLPNTYELGWSLMLTYPLVGAGMTLIIIGVTKGDDSVINKLLKNVLLVYLGKISYGLYMFHLFSLSLVILITQMISGNTTSSNPPYQTLYFFAGLLMTIFLSMVSYSFLEKPFLQLKQRFSLIASRPK